MTLQHMQPATAARTASLSMAPARPMQSMQPTSAWQPQQPANLFQPVPTARARQSSQQVSAQLRGVHEKMSSMSDSAFSSPLANFAMAAIQYSNRVNSPRDVSMKAGDKMENAKEAREWIDAWRKLSPGDKSSMVKAGEAATMMSMKAGVTPPFGFFDIGFTTTASEGKIRFYREVELKHGRVAMLASLGILVGEKFHPLFGGNIDVPSAFAFQETPLQQFWPAVLAVIAIPESFSIFKFENPLAGGDSWMIRSDHEPGDYGYDPLGLKPKDAKDLLEMQNKEINNGRLAMIATVGMLGQELATGQKVW